MKYKKILLTLIIILTVVLRFWRLNEIPAFNADEAAIGYNAYSLIQTGLDEHGNGWPIHFQSFNDYKPGLYFYIILPFVKFIGLNEWAVRIPGALFGVGTVWVIYLLVKELSINKKFTVYSLPFAVAEIAGLFLAISPWHIHFSRGGWEVNVATFFMTLGVWLFLKALKIPKYYSLSLLSFALSLYVYHAARVVVPLLGIGLVLIYKDEVLKNVKPFLISLAVLVMVLLPLGYDLIQGNVLSRAAGVGLFADTGPFARINEQRGEHDDFTGLSAKIFHNKGVNYGLAFLDNWSEHYWGEFLFLSGDVIERNRVPETGQMYMQDLLFVVAGLVGFSLTFKGGSLKGRKSHPEFISGSSVGKNKILNQVQNDNRGILLILWWLIVAPTAAALTFQSPHALRAHNMIIPLIIISAYGFVYIVEWSKKNINSSFLFTVYCLLFTVIAWQFTRYQHMYWVHMSKEFPFSSQYGLKELVSYVDEEKDKFDRVYVTNRYDQPYILFLFYSKFPPEKFQKTHALTARDGFGFSTVAEFDKFHFGGIDWDQDQPIYTSSLIIGTDEEIPDEANIVKEIYGSNGYKYFQIVAN